MSEEKKDNKEVKEILRRLVCFDKQKDADYFINQVSKCSLKIIKS